MRIHNEDLLDDTGPLDLSVAQDLKPVWLGHIMHYSIQLAFSGTPAGTFKLQASNDAGRINAADSDNQAPISHWTDIADSSITVAAAGDCLWQVENVGYNWVRVVWTPSAGTGSLTSARANVKGV